MLKNTKQIDFMLPNVIFWFVIFLKPVFWSIFSSNYAAGTFAWAAAIFFLLFLQAANKKFYVNLRTSAGWQLYFIYFVFCVLSSFSQGATDTLYALLLIIPLAHQALYVSHSDSVKPLAIGVTAALWVMFFVTLASGTDDLSSRNSSGEIGPNTIGLASALSAYLSYRTASSSKAGERIFWWFGALFAVTVLLLTVSKTSIAAFLVAIFFSSPSLQRFHARSVILIICFFVFVFFDYGSLFVSRIAAEEITFTGRTLLWAGILDYVSGWPVLIGNGYNSSVKISSDIGFDIFRVTSFTHAHNSYLEAYLNTGIFGVIFIFAIIFFGLKCLFSKIENKSRFVTFRGVFIIFLVRSLTEASFSQPGSSDSLLFFSMFLYVSWAAKNGRLVMPARAPIQSCYKL
ncbi:O-antigen ligase family protein [Azoarcus sp. PA01]|nr:O-antigen ligase family protein [Azoarcus sp. PA01]